MLEWGTEAQQSDEDEAAFRERVISIGNEFTASYPRDALGGEGADVYSYGAQVRISSAGDDDEQHAVVLSVAQMTRLAQDWARYVTRYVALRGGLPSQGAE